MDRSPGMVSRRDQCQHMLLNAHRPAARAVPVPCRPVCQHAQRHGAMWVTHATPDVAGQHACRAAAHSPPGCNASLLVRPYSPGSASLPRPLPGPPSLHLPLSTHRPAGEYEVHEDHIDWEAIKAEYDALPEREKERWAQPPGQGGGCCARGMRSRGAGHQSRAAGLEAGWMEAQSAACRPATLAAAAACRPGGHSSVGANSVIWCLTPHHRHNTRLHTHQPSSLPPSTPTHTPPSTPLSDPAGLATIAPCCACCSAWCPTWTER